MGIIDLHCDTIHKIFHMDEKSLYENSYSVDIKKMQQGNVVAQFFALFLDKGWIEETHINIYEYAKDFYKVYISQIEENKEYIRLATNYSDLENNLKEGVMSAFLTIEEGDFPGEN